MKEFWMITLQWGDGYMKTIPISKNPAEWMIEFGRSDKNIVFAMQITADQFDRLSEFRP